MWLDILEPADIPDSPPARLDPRVKLLALLAFVLALSLWPLDKPRGLLLPALILAFLVGWAGVEIPALLRRALAVLPVILFLAVMIAWTDPRRPQLGWLPLFLAILAKNLLAVLAVLAVARVTPFRHTVRALRDLGLPNVFVCALQSMIRSVAILLDELDRLLKARRCRAFGKSPARDWRIGAGVLGALFIRSLERSERVHAAMLARGFDGTPRALEDPRLP